MEKGCRYTRQQYTRTGLGEERKSGRNLEPNRRSLLAGVWSDLGHCCRSLSHLPFWGGTKGLRQRGKGRNWGRCAQGIRGHHLHCCLQKRQHLTAKRHNHYLMPVPYQHFLLRWSKKNYRVTPKCSNALLRTWTSQFWCWSEIHTVN